MDQFVWIPVSQARLYMFVYKPLLKTITCHYKAPQTEGKHDLLVQPVLWALPVQ